MEQEALYYLVILCTWARQKNKPENEQTKILIYYLAKVRYKA